MTAGVDGRTALSILLRVGVEEFLGGLRASLKDRSFRPLPVRERMIPKPGGKLRRLGIATITDRVVQASLKLVLEPIFEADFLPCSYGFRPGRRAHDAVAEIRHLATNPRRYEWIVEGDIKACFDEIDHGSLMSRVCGRIADKRVLGLVKAFLKAGILGEDRQVSGDQRRDPARVDLVSSAQQRRLGGAGRAHRPAARGSGQQPGREGWAAAARPAELQAGPVCRLMPSSA
ncbi:reverse transcriptase domain-containing protein [Actinoplanes sp. NPDC051513]|uniref:reverse transcriptase domain-containing protein n=1 Tax=Actinoplanes sp. NPDC051513 TaxID=3363908 RepID=UPI00379EC893